MAKKDTLLIDAIKKEASNFNFPSTLHFNEYRDDAKMKDIVQVYFRYHPFGSMDDSAIREKFGFEIAFSANASLSVNTNSLEELKIKEIKKNLRTLEQAWKGRFTFVKYRGVPYARRVTEDTFKLKCELCNEQMCVEGEEVEYRQDLYLIYCLKNIDCDCDDGWDVPEAGQDVTIPEGAHFPRSDVTERLK
jgi:hypothetical protein